ncbi:MAG: protein kinase domain-containing protein, partial [Gemmataceae bacterium]
MANRWICLNGHTLREQPSRPVCPTCGAALMPLVPVGAAVEAEEGFDTLQPVAPSRPPERGPSLPPARVLVEPEEEDETERTAVPPSPPAKTEVPNGRPTAPAAFTGINDANTLVPPPSSAGATPSIGRAGSAAGFQVLPGYEILGVLGRGGMGVVYKARQSGLNRVVALKMIISGPHASEEELNRFKTEAEAVAALQHPNIVQIHDMGVRDGRPFFSLEFCEGGSLQSRLDGTPMVPQAAARLLRTLADAVGYAHGQGIIHRDLKPANILLLEGADHPLERCTPKITDFGLAKRLGDDQGNTATEAILGTPTYMAPEQAQGKTRDAGPSADVYALGAILYDLMTGRPPFKGASALDTIQMVQTAEPVPPTRLQPGVPADLQTITLKCLEKDPKKRYATATDLAADLSRFLEGRPILARAVSPAERAMKFVRRNPLLAALLAVCFVAPTVLAAVMVAYSVQLAAAKKTADDARDAAVKAEDAAKEDRDRARLAEDAAKKDRDRALAAEEAAQESFLKVQQAVERLVRLSEARLRFMAGTDEGRKALLQDALRMSQLLTVRQGDSPTAALRVALGHRLVGDIEEKLGDYGSALDHFDRAAASLKAAVAARPELTPEAAGVELLRWKVLATTDPARADGVLDGALARLDGMPQKLRDGKAARWTRAAVLATRAIHHRNRSAPEQAMKDLDDAAALLEGLARDEDAGRQAEVRQELARVFANRAGLKLAQAQGGGPDGGPADLLAAALRRPADGRGAALKAAEADCDRAVEQFEGLLAARRIDPEVMKE